MSRKMIDCRRYPSEPQCTLNVTETEEEVLTVIVRHAIEEHGYANTPDLRDRMR
jgi:predicted small metal-binding protein